MGAYYFKRLRNERIGKFTKPYPADGGQSRNATPHTLPPSSISHIRTKDLVSWDRLGAMWFENRFLGGLIDVYTQRIEI